MAPPGNGIFVVRGEMATLMTAMKRGARWNSASYQEEEQDSLMKQFVELKATLNHIEDLRLVEPIMFLGPFLDVIKSEETTGPITSLALSTVNKFLSYGLIDPTHPAIVSTVEAIADAVTHARFVGTDQASDGVVLMKIVQVLRTLMLNPEGSVLTNESVCEVMLSCFRICFEPRLNELLRKTAEHALKDIVLLLFMRLPQFAEERNAAGLIRKLKMIAGGPIDQTKKRKVKVPKAVSRPVSVRKTSVPSDDSVRPTANEEGVSPVPSNSLHAPKAPVLATTPATPQGNIVDMQGKILQTPLSSTTVSSTVVDSAESELKSDAIAETEPLVVPQQNSLDNDADIEDDADSVKDLETAGRVDEATKKKEDYVNTMGVRFTPVSESEDSSLLIPYGLPCIRELLRFLISLCNPQDKQNTDTMMHMGLSLLTVALEVGADHIGKYESLMGLVKDEMCRNLFALLNSERLTIFAADLQVCFLLFESLRSDLKFHLEFYLTKISDIVSSEKAQIAYEMRELALDNIIQFCRIPGFAAELYINYDCNLYCTDLLENLVKLLSKNTLSATSPQTIYSVHQMSLDGLLQIVQNIEKNCAAAKSGRTDVVKPGRHSRNNSNIDGIVVDSVRPDLIASGNESSGVENISSFSSVSAALKASAANKKAVAGGEVNPKQLLETKDKKRILTQGTELFNQRPDKGIQFLQDNGILKATMDPMEVALFLRANAGLDKAMIGEYISKKKNVELKILENFVKSFDFTNTRIDLALRQYLETFRLPGEAPLIFLVMEHFAEHWHQCNNEPFVNTDSAFRLAYAIIMLNMDQHNYNAKRLNIPMTVDDFAKNLRGLNGNGDFDQTMLADIYNGIKNEEIIMPAEQTGLIRENYLWKVLLRRGVTKDAIFNHVSDATHDPQLFQLVWGSTLAAISYIFEKTADANAFERPLAGLSSGAIIAAHYNLHADFDGLVLTLCKFTTLLNVPADSNEISTAVAFAANPRSQLALQAVFGLIHEHGDCIRESWKSVVEVIVQLFRAKLLPRTLMEVEDFCEANGKMTLLLEKPIQKVDAGIFSTFYSYLSSEGQRQPTYEEQEQIKIAKRCVRECQIDQIIAESKFLQFESLQDLLASFCVAIKPPTGHKSLGLPYAEEVIVFQMELMVKILVQNRDRVLPLWTNCRDQMYLLLVGSASCGYQYLLGRTTVAILKLAIYLMRNEELCSAVLQSLKMLLMLKPAVIFATSKQISIGIYELLKTSAQNIHSETDWDIIFTLLECVGAGAIPPEVDDPVQAPVGTKSDGAISSEDETIASTVSADRGYTSDSDLAARTAAAELQKTIAAQPYLSPSGENWILVNKDTADDVTQLSCPSSPSNSLTYPCRLLRHSSFALVKCWDSLAFIVRNVAHITPYNFESCVKCIRTFVEASLNGGKHGVSTLSKQSSRRRGADGRSSGRQHEASSESEDEDLQQRYEFIAIQLLDLMHTLHTRTAQIFRWWAEEGGALPQHSALWAHGWCPLLQGIARLANDRRRQVRMSAITCLQRALLVHDLQTLTGPEWASCFKQVIFPLLHDLLAETSPTIEPALLDESRIRTATIMSKVFLHHLTPLIALNTFSELWLEILDYLQKFIGVGSDMLYEAMLEGLKNMLLVMHSVQVFHLSDGVTHNPLWDTTWTRIGQFLPQLKEELFKTDVHQSHNIGNQNAAHVIPPIAAIATIQTQVPQLVPQTLVAENPTPVAVTESSAELPIELPPQNQPQPNILLNNPMEPQPQAQHHVPYLLDQAQQQFALMEQQYAQQLQQAQLEHQQQLLANQMSSNNVALDMGDSEPESLQPHFDAPNYGEAPIPIATEGENQPLVDAPVAETPTITNGQPEPLVDTLSNDLQPKVPISHLLAGNAYPSLTNPVPASIAQSFTPIFVQPQTPAAQLGGDIYNDYVQNPYNLVLQPHVLDQHSNSVPFSDPTGVQHPAPVQAFAMPVTTQASTNVFQNYFNTEQTAHIPPGSEMLFGGP